MKPKIIICGTGRAGTTLLVRILTTAGFDTGFDADDIKSVEGNIGRAGLEKIPTLDNIKSLPQVIKGPQIVDVLPKILSDNWFPVGLAIIPVRNLNDAAQSRKEVHKRALSKGFIKRGLGSPGGLWKTRNPNNQRQILSEQFYKTVQILVDSEVPTIFLSFPKFAVDADYFDRTISRELHDLFGSSRDDINAAYLVERNPDLITVDSGREENYTEEKPSLVKRAVRRIRGY